MSSLFGNWFKTQGQLEAESKAYMDFAFPYGDIQQEKLKSIVDELKGKDDISMAFYFYLLTKQECSKFDFVDGDYKDLYSKLSKIVKGKSKDNICKYIVLAKYDLKINKRLAYPKVDRLLKEANELETSIINK